MTEQVQAQTESASPAAPSEPSVVAATESPSQPTTQTDAPAAERAPDGKFVKRGLPEAWKSKPDQFAAERAAANAAPPVPSEQAPPVPVAAHTKRDANFVPQPRFDQVIAERSRAQQELQSARRELEEHRAEIQRLRSYQPPVQPAQEQLPPELAEYFGVPSNQPAPAVQQLLQQVQQQQQFVQQMQQQQAIQASRTQLDTEARQAYSSLIQHGLRPEVAQAAIQNGMLMVAQNDQLQVIDAAAMWYERHRALLDTQAAAPAAAPRQSMQAPPVPTHAPTGSPATAAKPAHNAPYSERINYLTSIIGR